jgi:peptide/nickel transport system permease protein
MTLSERPSPADAAEQAEPQGPPPDEVALSRGRLVLRRFLRSKESTAGAVLIVLLFLLAFLGPYLTGWGFTDHDFTALRVPPSTSHWFGTTQTGRDVFALTMSGMQKSLIIALLAGVISTALAAIVGAVAGYFGGWRERGLNWIVELLLVVPQFLIVSILSPLFVGSTWLLLPLLLGVFQWMITARIVRGLSISEREREYVLAAKYMGVSPIKIITRHILPNMSSFLIIDFTLQVSFGVIAATALSYFGFGVQPPDVSLGTLIQAGTPSATTFPWLFGFAALMLVLIVLSVNLLGDGLRDAFDPTSGKERE